jgi:hypothetical protein
MRGATPTPQFLVGGEGWSTLIFLSHKKFPKNNKKLISVFLQIPLISKILNKISQIPNLLLAILNISIYICVYE